MECKIVDDLLTESINQSLDSWLKELEGEGFKLKKGEQYDFASDDIEFLKDFFNQKILERFGEDYVDEVDLFDYPAGTMYNSIIIKPNYSNLLAEHLVAQSKGEPSVLFQNKDGVENARNLLNESIEKRFKDKQDELQNFLAEATVSLKKITRIGQIKNFIQDNAITKEGNLLQELRRLYSSMYANLHNDDFVDKTKALGNYLLEASTKTDAYLEFIKNEDNLVKLQEIYTLAKGYMPLFKELSSFLSNYKVDNPLARIVRKTNADLEAIESIYLKKAADVTSKELFEVAFNHPRRMANINKKREMIKNFEKLKADAVLNKDLKSENYFQKKIDKLKKDIENLDITSNKLKDYITGKEGDITLWSSLFMSASSNSDLIVSGMGEMFRRAMGRLNQEKLIPISKRFFNMMDEYGENIISPEKHFKKFVRKRKSFYYDYEQNEIVEREIYELLHSTDPKFYEQREYKEAQMKEANHMLRQTEEGSKEWLKWSKAKTERLKALADFYDAHQERKYVSSYYNTRVRHKEEIAAFKEKFKDYIERTGFDIDKIYDGLKEEQNSIYESATLLGKFKLYTNEQRDRLAEIRRDKRRIRSVEYIKATMEEGEDKEIRLELAELLSKQRREENDFQEYILTDEGQDLWEKDLAALEDIKDQLTKDQYHRLKSTMVDYQYPDEFTDALNTLLNKKGELLKKITDITGFVAPEAIASAWTKIRDTALPYRDNQGVIEGYKLNTEEQKSIADLQKFIFGQNNSMLDILNIREDKNKINARISELVAILRGGGSSNSKKIAYEELQDLKAQKASLKENAINQYGVSELIKELVALNAELNELILREPTEYYYEELNKQRDLFIQENPLTEDSFEFNGFEYRIIDNKWHLSRIEMNDFKPLAGSIANVWRSVNEENFQQSEWYQNNHNLREYYDGKEMVSEYQPSYIWVKTFPRDKEKYPFQETASFKYKTLKVKDEFLTENSLDEFTNRAKAVGFRNKDYYDMQGTKDGKLLNKLLKEYKEAQDLFPPGKRMGYRIPSISRENNIINIFTNPELRKKSTQHQLLLRDTTTTEQDIDEGEALADTEGVEIRSLPHYYSSYLDIDLVSTDVVSSIMRYSMAAAKTQFMRNELVPTATSLLDVMAKKTPSNNKKDKVWSSIYSKLDNEFINRMGLKGFAKQRYNENNRLAIMAEFVDTFIYGMDVSSKHKAELQLGKRTFRLDKILGKLRGIKSFLTMAALPGSYIIANQMGNVANGIFNQLIHTLVRDGHFKFTFKQWLAAHVEYGRYSVGIMGSNEGSLAGDYLNGRIGESQSKFGKLMDHFNVLENRVQDEHYQIMRDKNHWRKLFRGDFLFFIRNAAELRLYGTTFLAYMKSQQVEINGQKATLWDAYDGNKLKANVTMDGQPVNEDIIRTDIQYMLRITQGNYAKFDKTLLENRWYGSGIMWMKKFWVEFFLARYGTNRFNVTNQDMIEGYWLTTFNNLKETLYDDPRKWGQNIKNLSDDEKVALKKAGLELAFIVSLGAITSLLFGYDEDDEERFKKMEERNDMFDWGLYFLLKSKSEAESMTMFGGLDETWKNVTGIPGGVFPYGKDVIDIFKDDIKWYGPIPWTDYTKRKQFGYDEGTSKLYIKAIKLLTITKPSRFSAEETIRNFEKSKNR